MAYWTIYVTTILVIEFQISRWVYNNIKHLQTVIERNRDANVPFDVQYLDIESMNSKKDFTIDRIHFPELNQYVSQLNQEGIKIVIILDLGMIDDHQDYYAPTIEGIQEDVFIQWKHEQTLIRGACWSREVFLPGNNK